MLLDSLGSFCSLLATYYFIRLNKKAWIISLGTTLLNGWLYWVKGIYADMTLEGFYFLSACYGWYLWQPSSEKSTINLPQLSKGKGLLLLFVVILLYGVIKTGLSNFTPSDVATLDALTASLSIVAQCLMCYRLRATWLLWLITDAIYAYLYWIKQLPFHSLLMLIYTLLAILGYLNWRKKTHSA